MFQPNSRAIATALQALQLPFPGVNHGVNPSVRREYKCDTDKRVVDVRTLFESW